MLKMSAVIGLAHSSHMKVIKRVTSKLPVKQNSQRVRFVWLGKNR